MARIELRNTRVFIQDGLSGSCAVNDVAGGIIGDTSLTVDGVSTNFTPPTEIPVGARFEHDGTIHTVTGTTTGGGITTEITFTPALTDAIADDAVINILHQEIEIKIGEGDISWTESRSFIYDRDRQRLDTVRQDEDQPLSIDISFTFDWVRSQSGRPITPVEALKAIGPASDWVSSSSDLCEPYAVNIKVTNCPPCGNEHGESITFPDFRWESLDYSVADASISVSGQCNVTEAIASRSATVCD